MAIGKILSRGLAFQNVVNTGIASCLLPIGRTIERITLAMGGTTFTENHMAFIRIRANGKVIFDVSGAELKKLNAFRGLTQTAGFLTIDFTELRGRDLLDQVIGGFDTSPKRGIAQLSLEVSIVGATAPTLEAFILQSSFQNDGVGSVIQKILRYPYNIAAGGLLPIQLPFGPVSGSIIKRIHIVEGTADRVTECTVKQDSVVVFEATDAVNSAHLVEHGKVPQAGIFTIDFTADNNQRNAFNTRDARSLELIPKFSGADNGTVLVEYYDVLGNQ